MTHPYHAVKGRMVPSFPPKSSVRKRPSLRRSIVWSEFGLGSISPTAFDLEPQLLALAIERAGVDAQDAGGVFAAGAALEQEPDMLGLELFEADGQSDLDRRSGGSGRTRPQWRRGPAGRSSRPVVPRRR